MICLVISAVFLASTVLGAPIGDKVFCRLQNNETHKASVCFALVDKELRNQTEAKEFCERNDNYTLPFFDLPEVYEKFENFSSEHLGKDELAWLDYERTDMKQQLRASWSFVRKDYLDKKNVQLDVNSKEFDWAKGEPNNLGGNEKCVVWRRSDEKMNDLNCDGKPRNPKRRVRTICMLRYI